MKPFITLLLGFAFLAARAQTATPELISSSGASFSNATYQMDWSVGEISTETYSNDDHVLTQGFHHGVYVITTVFDCLFSEIIISVSPNPTDGFINLKVESKEIERLAFSVTDLTGIVIQTEMLSPETEPIDFSDYATGTYFITVSQNNQVIRSFKIIKNQ
jgi:hypothetical protein